MENPALNIALDGTASQQPAVMPTAVILKQEYEKVNSPENSSTEDAKISLKKDGTPRKKYERKSSGTEQPKKVGFVGGVETAKTQDEADKAAKRRDLAVKAISLVEQSGTMIAHDAAKMDEVEKAGMIVHMDDYLKSKNLNDLPAGVTLCISLGFYYGRVLNAPLADKETASQKMLRWIYFKYQAIRGRKQNARSDNGNDRQRENNTSKGAG